MDSDPPGGVAVDRRDPYAVLGLAPSASATEIKAAYRALVKRHHPDAGGDELEILALNAAWEVLGDADRRRDYDRRHAGDASAGFAAPGARATAATAVSAPPSGKPGDQELLDWLQHVFAPVDRLLGQVINPFPGQLRALAADPYDDRLMEAFCAFLEASGAKLAKVEALYRGRACPPGLEGLSLDLYHCLSLVKDSLADLERYTMGYVDSYLRDGRELLRQAKARRSSLQADVRQLRR